MQNRYRFIGGRDLDGRMFVYEKEMNTYDLSSQAIRDFAYAIREGRLDSIKNEFTQLTNKQKLGLLNLMIDYNDLGGNFLNLSAPYGYPIDLANRFGFKDIAQYLSNQKETLDNSYENKSKLTK